MANQERDSYHGEDETPRDAQWEALARFVAGECTSDEAAAVEEQLSRSSDVSALVSAIERVTARLAVDPLPDVDVERALASVRNRLAADEVHSLDAERARRRSGTGGRGSWWVAALAAGLVIVAGTTLLLRNRHGIGVEKVAESGARTYASPVGARDSVKLADGTRVLLGPGSALTVSAGYGRSDRDVTLRGEAFIEVAHRQSPPFTVHAGAATIRDVGTAFAVHSDSGTGVRVVVTTGAVLLRRAAGGDSGTLLRAGDVGLLGRGDSVVARRGRATPDDLAWTRGELVFRDASMDDVRGDLRRWYGIELVVADSLLARQHFNNTFHNDSPDQVLRVIASTFGARIERHGDTAIVRDAREGGTR
jgi:transmembrane sensor